MYCLQHSEVTFHRLGLKCKVCGSYNTCRDDPSMNGASETTSNASSSNDDHHSNAGALTSNSDREADEDEEKDDDTTANRHTIETAF